MPYDYEIDEARSRVVVHGQGFTGMAEAKECFICVGAEPRIRQDYDILIVLGAGDFVPSAQEGIEIAEYIRNFVGHMTGRIAGVAPEGRAAESSEFVSLVASLTGKASRTFTNRREAEEWLDGERRRSSVGSTARSA